MSLASIRRCKESKYFRLARLVALKGDTKEADRRYRLAAVGIRADGTIVVSSNLPSRNKEPQAHAERRLVRKLDWGSIVYVVRIKRNGKLGISRPCRQCQIAMKSKGVKYCYYSIAENEWGRIDFH